MLTLPGASAAVSQTTAATPTASASASPTPTPTPAPSQTKCVTDNSSATTCIGTYGGDRAWDRSANPPAIYPPNQQPWVTVSQTPGRCRHMQSAWQTAVRFSSGAAAAEAAMGNGFSHAGTGKTAAPALISGWRPSLTSSWTLRRNRWEMAITFKSGIQMAAPVRMGGSRYQKEVASAGPGVRERPVRMVVTGSAGSATGCLMNVNFA